MKINKKWYLILILILTSFYSKAVFIVGTGQVWDIQPTTTADYNCHDFIIRDGGVVNVDSSILKEANSFTIEAGGILNISGTHQIDVGSWTNNGLVTGGIPTITFNEYRTCSVNPIVSGESDTDGDGVPDNEESCLDGNGLPAFLDANRRCAADTVAATKPVPAISTSSIFILILLLLLSVIKTRLFRKKNY